MNNQEIETNEDLKNHLISKILSHDGTFFTIYKVNYGKKIPRL